MAAAPIGDLAAPPRPQIEGRCEGAIQRVRSEPSVGKEVEEVEEEEEEGEAAWPTVQDLSRNLRRRLSEERATYRRKLQAYREGQERQAVLVQKLQGKVGYRPEGGRGGAR
ncbi:hypothetical protein chiPu_0027464 [Chiloscyllium punctatum]|uniref:Uncharacterized protein n=1 Tax=Chiloscyllium punctatum TaxID=137246 RepID=A0A401TLE5_CHIPU|nr:hypothetical protein [Chiloscyllium punctatum]